MKLINIDGKEEFILKSVSLAANKEGKRCLHVSYAKQYAEYILEIETYTENPEARVVEKISYANFRRRYPRHRIYITGFVEVEKGKCLEPTA